jgi:hypothetical protein
LKIAQSHYSRIFQLISEKTTKNKQASEHQQQFFSGGKATKTKKMGNSILTTINSRISLDFILDSSFFHGKAIQGISGQFNFTV